MKIKLDENIPSSLVGVLGQHGHDVDTVMEEGLAGATDSVVWDAAQRARRFLVTQDLDFSDVRKYRPGEHAGIMLIRLRNASRTALFARIRSLFVSEPVDSWRGGYVVVTEHRLRIRLATRGDMKR